MFGFVMVVQAAMPAFLILRFYIRDLFHFRFNFCSVLVFPTLQVTHSYSHT